MGNVTSVPPDGAGIASTDKDSSVNDRERWTPVQRPRPPQESPRAVQQDKEPLGGQGNLHPQGGEREKGEDVPAVASTQQRIDNIIGKVLLILHSRTEKIISSADSRPG